MKESIGDVLGAPSDGARIERLTHHIVRIYEAMEDMRRSQDEMRVSMRQFADALTRLVLLEERQATASNAIERMVESIGRLDERLRKLEVSDPLQAKSSEWIMSAMWAAAAAAVMFIAAKTGLL